MKTTQAVAAIGLLLPVLAMAQANTPRVDRHQVNQEARIQQGPIPGP